LIDAHVEDNTKRAALNLPKFKYFSVDGVNVYDLLKYDGAVLSKSSIEAIVGKCSTEVNR
jgi:large subunit ribosomal protein L4